MPKFARLSEADADGFRTAVEVIDVSSLSGRYHPDVAALFSSVPAQVEQGWRFKGSTWSAPEEAPAPEPTEVYRTQLSRPEFKLQFTSAERIAIRTARDYSGNDPDQLQVRAVLNDFFDIVEDPALSYVDLELPATIEGIEFLADVGLIDEARVPEILQGLAI